MRREKPWIPWATPKWRLAIYRAAKICCAVIGHRDLRGEISSGCVRCGSMAGVFAGDAPTYPVNPFRG